MAKDYSHLIINEYKYWTIYINENQGFLGRCIIWCKRKDALDLTDATPEEREELFVVLDKLKVAVSTLYSPDILNYAFLGNITYHLHGHFIPRYKTEREVDGVKFYDKLYGQNYRTDNSFVTSSKVLKTIQNDIKNTLG